jgi:hypothetical protein
MHSHFSIGYTDSHCLKIEHYRFDPTRGCLDVAHGRFHSTLQRCRLSFKGVSGSETVGSRSPGGSATQPPEDKDRFNDHDEGERIQEDVND